MAAHRDPFPAEAASPFGTHDERREERLRTDCVRVDWSEPQGRVRAGPLAVRVLGSGTPTLLLHGLLGSNRYWGGAFDRLADGGTLLVPDLLGFGASPRPLSGYGPEEHGRAVIASLRDLNVREPSLVVGHSLGALVAIWLACNHPERVRGVIAFAPPLFRDARHMRRQIAKQGVLQRVFGLQNPAATWLARLACRNLCSARPRLATRLYSALRPALPTPVLEDATRHSWISYSETVTRVILAADGAKWVAAALPPIVIVAGTQDRYLDVEFLRELVDGRPHHRLEVWDGEGHDLPLTRPDRCLDLIERWRRVAARS
ncbi:alpha/beta fold hydrolase [Anaeromyxobacter terrae]|uniref:alpha/beta fold hydrolase n=1 Tax=Anaeromyxobacter terrae TaxID=2925406 RepID=UPI001F55D402|nr:alpha/beta hydrolase [Anaeromyxobacter sp. SG22]